MSRPARIPRTLAPLAALAAAVVATASGLLGVAPTAQALSCPAGFEHLPGCSSESATSTATTAGSWSTETIAGMSVHLYVPSSAPALAAGRALMVSLHGCVQTATDLRGGANWVQTAEEHGMVVALPAAPNGGVLVGCWDYYDSNHSRTQPSRHDDNLLGLVSTLTGRAALGIDPDQVYLSGLSSGGGETMVMGCLAPDVFAGIGINAGPTVGTTSGQIGYVAVSESQGASTCRSFAGSAAGAFATQLTSIVYGSDDTTVTPGYNTLNGEIMAGIYGAETTSTFSLADLAGSNRAGSGTLYSDAQGPRVSVIQNSGLGHNWPAGGGPGGRYISTNSIDYPAYVTEFFFANNRRVDPTQPTPTPEPTPTPTPEPTPTPTPEPTPTPTPEPTPTPTPTPEPTSCVTATNQEHELADRAVSYGSNPYNPYYAVGTQDYLGQGDATVVSLRQLSPTSWDHVPSC
ncbi:PHB depolymerase family esterase [Agrococcus sp. HG114]|uniref:extracellular catalytic domain type 1 short-chain-length polyhydroxyalkanoate depolymerase n=1 Tax=Agrococcus sp. HG114 TaxID=2969757 RepID=UPI00215A94C0|nr:PHB depolymerase family esterase [Agrococcus sp. HG114]MCR8670477.1 PHB depolymerase family esterase [Agrococcus sp. HG114]